VPGIRSFGEGTLYSEKTTWGRAGSGYLAKISRDLDPEAVPEPRWKVPCRRHRHKLTSLSEER
jgi:hypothetical protein